MKLPLRDWRKLEQCEKFLQHSLRGGVYQAVAANRGGVYVDLAVNSEGLLAVVDWMNRCVHLLTKEGALVRSIGKGVLGVVFDLKGNVWVTEYDNNKVVKLSQDGRLLQTIHHASSGRDCFCNPMGVSVSPEGLIYICDSGNHRVSVHDVEGKSLFAFGSKGSGPGCFDTPCGIAFGSDGLVYVSDVGNGRVCVWSKEGTFKKDFQPKYAPTCIAATSDNHLLITSHSSHTAMVYTLEGELVHEFGGGHPRLGWTWGPEGICVDDNGVVYVADVHNKCIQVF